MTFIQYSVRYTNMTASVNQKNVPWAFHASPQQDDMGTIKRETEIRIPVSTHALHYGTSVFEGIKFYDCGERVVILKLKAHMERLYFSAEKLGFHMQESFPIDEMNRNCLDVVSANVKEGFREGYIRPLVYGNSGVGLGGGIGKFAIAIMFTRWVKDGTKPSSGIWVGFSSYIRPHPQSVCMKAKVGGYYVSNIMAAIEGINNGGWEPLCNDHQGNLAEAPASNIFFVKDGKLVAPVSDAMLPGITRSCVLEMAELHNIPVCERTVQREELLTADEVFLSSTASEIMPVGTVGNTRIGNEGKMGAITEKIWQTYTDAIHGRVPELDHWLTTVP